MNTRLICLSVAAMLATTLGCSAPAAKPAGAHWGYTGDVGPSEWSSLSDDYALCAAGTCQSPINVAAPRSADLANPEFDYSESAINIVNNGHSIQVNYDGGSTLELDGKYYELLQFHFHAPSEHRVGGRAFPIEMHLVHKADDGQLAVVGVLVAEGRDNPAFAPVWAHLPETVGPAQTVPGVVDAGSLLPAARTSYRYGGSLTTPPCSEGVQWLILTTPVEMSAAQIRAFTRIHSGNNRPVQPLHGRTVVEDTSP
jgi:carbonic anhydrase